MISSAQPLPTAPPRRPSWSRAATGELLFFYPLIVDSTAFLALVLSGSRPAYQAAQLLGEVIVVCLALWHAKHAIPKITQSFGISIYIPALLLSIVSAVCLARGNDNAAFPLASLRYIFWMLFAFRLAGSHHTSNLFWGSATALAILSVLQLVASPAIAGVLQTIYSTIAGDTSTNAVLTSIALGKVFASLTAKNPIELSYLGLALLCISLSQQRRLYRIISALTLVICGRSNTAIIAAAIVALLDATSGMALKRGAKLAVSALLLLATIFALYLPRIYLGEDSTWEDLITVLSYQRLGMLIAVPELIAQDGGNILLAGMSTSLQDSVDALFASGILPPLFEDGGAIAIFDVVWIGMLVVGGIPFLAAGVILLVNTIRTARRLMPLPSARSLYLYGTACIVMSFSSQILLSRYGLFFLCYFATNLAMHENNRSAQ